MTNEPIVFDSTACWELAYASPIGTKLNRTYIEKGRAVHVSSLVLAELAAKAPAHADDILAAVKGMAIVVPVSSEIAEAGGMLRSKLRATDPSASLADAIHLSTARSLGAKLVSNDKAFARERDVLWPSVRVRGRTPGSP